VSDEILAGEIEALARQIVRRFDSDRAGALVQFKEILARKAPANKGLAGKLLQQLNRTERFDVVAALGATVTLDAKTHEQVVTEIARALAKSDRLDEAEALLARAAPVRAFDYNFQLAAGRVLTEARRHAKAEPYLEQAFVAKPTQQAAERLFSARLAQQRYEPAAEAMARILRTGSYRAALAKDFAFLLEHLDAGRLDPDLAFTLASLPGSDDAIGAALMPHLIAADMIDSVLLVVERDMAAFGHWDADVLIALVDYLAARRRIDQLLSIQEQYDGRSDTVRQRIARVLDALPIEQRMLYLTPEIAAKEYVALAQRFAKTGDAETGLRMLTLVPKLVGKNEAGAFYTREKSRLSRLAAHVVHTLDGRADAIEALIALILHVVEPPVAEFFSGPDFTEVVDAILAARRLSEGPDGSRDALLRDRYFPFFLERRTGLEPGALSNDIQFTECVFDYFHFTTQSRHAVSVPVGEVMRERMARPAMAIEGGRTLDLLTNWGFMQGRPRFTLAPPGDYGLFYNWYLNGFFGERRLGPQLLNPGFLAFFNEVLARDPLTGFQVTRYLKLVARAERFDVANLIDRNLLAMLLVTQLATRGTQFLPFVEPLLESAVTQRVLKALGGAALLDALRGPLPPRPAARAGSGPQEILIVGHASKETGLGRNFGMLAEGLRSEGHKVTGLDFEAPADAFNAELRRWHDNLATRPIAVLAVNAHDVPDIFIKDRDGILDDCHVAGFYLWEVSTVPDVQRLGIALVDEVWAPTRYVADIYAPHKPTHVVGKGLFNGREPFLSMPKTNGANPRFTFVTVFDFDSSIERKNPLAAVRAFQQAFAGSEKVELVVKTSNVNPQHWSNAWRQWEKLVAAAAPDKRIRLITERFTGEEMTALVQGADCIVSLHRSEGFGYLMSDAMALGVPVIATDYSGNADFCNAETSFPVAYRLIPVPERAARWTTPGAQWADADVDAAAAQMRAVHDDYDSALARAARARDNIRTAYGMERFRAILAARVAAIAAGLSPR